MSLATGFIASMLLIVLGATGLTLFAIYLRSRAPEESKECEARQVTAVIERCLETGLYVGHVPGIPGAHAQAATLEELSANLQEVLGLLQREGIRTESRFVGTQVISVS